MCILIRLSPFDTLTHSNSPKDCSVIFRWNKYKVQTIDIIMYLFTLPNLDGDIRYRVLQSSTKIRISTIGNSMVKTVLNISLEGAKNLISLSLTNQSNDRNGSDGEPKISVGPKI